MKRIVLTFGLISGAVMAVLLFLETVVVQKLGAAQLGSSELVGYTTMLVAFMLVYFGIRSYRDTVLGGRIGFGRAFKVGALITLITSACYVGAWEVIYYNMMPDFAEQYSRRMIEKAKADGASPAQIEAKRAEMQKFQAMYANPLINVAMTLIEPLPVGLLIAALSAAILSRRKRSLGATASRESATA